MKFQTLSVLAGNSACNAKCPFCVSSMTGNTYDENVDINLRNLKKTYTLAWRSGVNTLIITGKGEPLLNPEHIYQYIYYTDIFSTPFPFIELQTNGQLIAARGKYLQRWRDGGLTTVMISVCHWDIVKNENIMFGGKHIRSIESMVDLVHSAGLNVRFRRQNGLRKTQSNRITFTI